MARTRTVDFLPEIFQTSTNRQFLSATLDQLVQEPNFKKIQGFVGRRVGPGINADDYYVTETDPVRADYQLEPGVVLVNPDNTRKIKDAITYPGITDALNMQGANTNRADRLYTSEYYAWDPFVDFDKFINFSQYYWLPAGPDAVDVYAETLPLVDNIVVTRENGVYTFSGINGTNPNLTLIRDGTYTFQVAQNNKETVNYRVTNKGTSAWVLDYQNNPTLTLVRGNTYTFTMVPTAPLKFYIKTQPTLGTNNLYNTGVTNNGALTGTITFVVPQDAPDVLYYNNDTQMNMQGTINIVDGTPGTGPGFWIQTDPGVNGRIPATPNISSRDVLGVVNNGEDLGTVTFNVPLSTAQDFYYNLDPIAYNGGKVDLVTTLEFDQINNQYISAFAEQNPNGIDGITNLNGRTVVFLNQTIDPEQGGWLQTTFFDPLPNVGNAISGLGSFDTTTFDQTTVVPESDRYNVWQIQYVTASGGGVYMQLTNVAPVANLEKFSIEFGTTYASTQWYKNEEGYFEQIPLLTANRQYLYYQDGTDPEIFGRIKLINEAAANYIDIADILGKKNYTSPNGVVFTNGLKVTFPSNVEPASYQNNTYYVEGVGTAIQLLLTTNYVTPETYTQSASIPFDSLAFDVGNFDANLNQPVLPDYLTVNRASPDLNAWTRSNRWFHVDVINASAEYNNAVPSINNEFRAKRPILEFRAGTRLYNFGTKAKQPVNIIDFSATDALSNINGSTGYNIDGYPFVTGSRVIFAADLDSQVRNKIYQVEFIVPDPTTSTIPVINLVPASDYEVLYDTTVVCLSGNTQQGLSYWFDGVDWFEAQQKTSVNQAPLFNVYDSAGVSFDNRVKYPSSDFTGSKLFSYAQGPGASDTVLGFPIKYLSLSNIGDIVFENNLYTDSFVYTRNSVSTTEDISLGFVREYADRVNYVKEIGWQTAITKSRARQQFRFTYDGTPLRLDIAVIPDDKIPSVQVFVGATFIEPSGYTVTTTSDTTTIIFSSPQVIGSVVEVDVLSDQASKVAFYQVPVNLENNPLNVNSAQFTLGTARAHYNTIGQNLLDISGPINGANNTRDLGNLVPYGQNILQQSAPMTLAGYFMRSAQYNIFAALDYNSNEYERFKVQLLDSVIRNDYTNYTIPAMLTAVMADINAGRTSLNPFYWSDMLPASAVYTESTTTYTPISTPVFNLSTTYDFTSSNFKGLLVYVNDVLLQFGYEYTVATDAPTLTITAPLSTGDVIVIQEYATTYGSFVPNTPTKLGLYPAFRPRIYLDTTYITPTVIIQGHDGSKTVAFGDFRDQLLLEFETRIFNNLKIKSDIPLTVVEVVPGQFRTTDYTLAEINQILSTSFLNWVGWNKIAYQPQNYLVDNQFTWNYSTAGNRISSTDDVPAETPLPVGAWRGIYQYFYDTPTPQSTPWEMLGFSQMPSWWTDIYGPAPYTSGNLVLWDDLAQGKVADPAGVYYKPNYARSGLTQVIPVDSEGQLLSPFQSVVGLYDSSQFQKSWTFGDEGPGEYAWRTSSSYPFAVMRLLALTRPAEFFSLFADRDLYKYDTEIEQYLYNQRYRLDANGIQVYGGSVNPITGAITAVSKASFIDWIVDYNQQLGRDSTTALTTDLANLDVRLCYRMGAFTDKQYLKIFTEKSSPNSQNSSLLLPDESYNLLLYKNQPFERVLYSSVIIEVVEDGYAVFGYSLTQPYFEILASRTAGTRKIISAGGETVSVPDTYSNDVVQIPYGYTFTNTTVVVDFLLSYGALLQSQGMLFDSTENGRVLNWDQMAQEFLYWVGQGWSQGNIINLNPNATALTATRAQSVVDSVLALTPENLLLDQNRNTLPVRDLVVDRYENTFKITSLSSQTISYIDLRYTSYESMVVLDNVSIFADLLYDPATGARQGRVNIVAQVSGDWNGQLDAQGFVLNNDATVEQWQPYRKYTKGEIVLYKNNYWSAAAIVQPKAEFLYSDWLPSDYTKIQRGLLQNLPNFSDQLANSYNVNTANLEQDSDLLAYGLIGFRPRQYMTDLNLNDISQVNLYQQFIHDKGTLQSVRLLTNADLGKETAEYQIFENWAVQRGVYGANANRSFIELRLNEALLLSDPSVIQIVEPQEISSADQTILYNDLWRESYKITSPQILPTTTVTVTDTALPSAGYVNLDDVDVTVFSLDAQLGTAPGVLDTIGAGTTIWAAKSNRYDWNIYRSTKIPGYVSACTTNLNNTSIVEFTQAHGLVVGSIVVIRFFDAAVNGVYRVLAVPDLRSIVIELTVRNTTTGNGIGFVLETIRVAQASDVLNLPYVNDLVPGARAWVDNNGQGLWQVIEKQQPFSADFSLEPALIYSDDAKFGSSITQGYNNISALIGSPGYQTVGAIYPYLTDDAGQYGEQPILLLGATDTVGYGNAVDIGYQSWAVAGASASADNQGYAAIIYRAPASAVFEQVQILIPPDYDGSSGEQFFGTSVAISQDERWLYIGAPGVNKVYAYGRVDIEAQMVQYTTSGTTNVYSINGIIEVDLGSQLNVVLNNVELVFGTDYELSDTTVSFNTIPPAGLKLVIARRYAQEFTGDGSTVNYDLEPYLYTISAYNMYSFAVVVDGVLQRPGIDYDLGGYVLQFVTPPDDGVLISMVSKTYFDYMSSMTMPDGSPEDANFGQSVTTATDGRQIIIGASVDNSDELDNSGSVYVFNRSVERFIVTSEYVADPTFPLPSGFENPVGVILNNQYLINDAEFFNGNYVVNVDSVTISTPLNIGDVVELESNIFTQVQKITANVPFDEAQYGAAVSLCPYNCSVYVGAPNDGTVSPGAGSVERRVNQARVYGVITGTVANPSLTIGDTIFINNTVVEVPAINTVVGFAAAINAAAIPNVHASTANGYLTISVVNVKAADEFNRLSVWPGLTGSAYTDLGFEPYAYAQTILSPNSVPMAHFGAAVFIDSHGDNLVVGAPQGTTIEVTTFDAYSELTYFDDQSTRFFEPIVQSGAVYTFDYLPSASDTVTNPGKFVFGQQILDASLKPLANWGTAVNYTNNRLLIGSPTYVNDDAGNSYGRVAQFNNVNNSLAWTVIREQQPVVDVYLLNSVFMYNKLQGTETYFLDFFDPLQGKILGAAQQNIDYLGAIDPAKYNTGPINDNGNFWGVDHEGEIWWNTDSVRFIDPNQDDITYASRRWGQTFPGSRVEIYQWVGSDVPPANYTGPGTPFSTESFTVRAKLTAQGVVTARYYFWVTGLTTIDTGAGKTLSTTGIARYIENPRGSGIPYMAALNASTVAIYNSMEYLSASDTILHIEFDRVLTNSNTHTEVELIGENKPESFLSANLYRKLQDSFCGVNSTGAKVPDPLLSPAERYGVQFRPRQSMFVDRFEALKNYLGRANTVMAQLPMVELRTFRLLNSKEPIPSRASNEWDKQLTNIEQLSFQDLYAVPLGYRYLVDYDATNNGLWTIYQVIEQTVIPGSPRIVQLVRVQTYDTTKYWDHIDWYQIGYDSTKVPSVEVPNYSALATLNATVGTIAKVTANAQGKFEIYILTDIEWERVGLQDGTIEFSRNLWDYSATGGQFGFDMEVFDAQYFDQEPVIETRKIIQAINEELFIADLAIERNRLLILMFNFVLTEFESPDWLNKTSLIDVKHIIRELVPYQIYRADNQEFVYDYLQEVKPYHVQVKEFYLAYQGLDQYLGSLTDFDNPSYYDTNLDVPQYINPILLPYTKSTAVGTGSASDIADTASNATIWTQWPWSQWFNNYTLSVVGMTVNNAGSGYVEAPELTIGTPWIASTAYNLGEQIFYRSNLYTVTIAGTTSTVGPTFESGGQLNGTATLTYAGVAAKATVIINSAGSIASVSVVEPGSGYVTTPLVSLNGITSYDLVPIMGNNLVRSIKTTMKYDRYEYSSNITDWSYTVSSYDAGTQVRYLGRVWQAIDTISNVPVITTATGSAGSYVITVASTAGLVQGLLVVAFNIPANTTVVDFDSNNNTVTLTQSLLGVLKSNTVDFYNVFNPDQWTRVSADSLSGVNRTIGFYSPTANQPGRQLSLLIDGIDYPGVQVFGPNFNQNTGFDVGNFDINPFDNISYGPDGLPTYDYGILDAIYSSPYVDPYLGTRATDINVDGGAYVDTYSSHAPEELIPGAEFDTLDMRVYTRPGADWFGRGHGFPEKLVKFAYTNVMPTVSYGDLLPYPILITVANQTWGLDMHEGIDYTVDYVAQTVTINNGASNGDIIVVTSYELGGGNQLYKQTYVGSDIGDTVTVPVAYDQIYEFAIFVNGVQTTDFIYADAGSNQTRVTFVNTYTDTDFISLVAIGPTAVDSTEVDYSWSVPITQIITATGSLTYLLDNSLEYTNPDNLIVTVDGVRARTSAGIEWYGDGSTEFLLPDRLGVSQSQILDSQVHVYLDEIAQQLSTDFVVTPYDPFNGHDGRRSVVFTNEPALGTRILIAVETGVQAYVNGDQLVFVAGAGLEPSLGQTIAVTTWNDTRQQNILTQVFVGPTTQGVVVSEGFDETDFDAGTVTGEPGSFDYSTGVTVSVNNLDLGRITVNPDRLNVTLNGHRLFYGQDFTINSTELILTSGLLNVLDTVMVTQFTQNVVPEAMAFRIFQDMRGSQTVYRITPGSTTVLTQELNASADVIYVDNASTLQQPNVAINIWGVITIGGERIMYRERNTVNNTVSGLLRGTAGTSAYTHDNGSTVYNMGSGNMLPAQFQNYILENTFLGDGTTAIFDTDITIVDQPKVYLGGSIAVTVDDILQPTSSWTLSPYDPVTIILTEIPVAGAVVVVTVTDLHGSPTSNTFTSTGSSGTFVTDLLLGLTLQSQLSYTINSLNPVTVTFNSAVAPGLTVAITDAAGLNATTQLQFGNGSTVTYQSDVVLTQPVMVYVGGTEQSPDTYTVTSIAPISVIFDTAPDSGVNVTILVRQGVTWYQQGATTASNGEPLQITETQAARFLRGL